MKALKSMEQYQSLQLYELGAEATDTITNPAEYIEGYKILNTYNLDNNQRKMLYKSFSSKDNYTEETKRCRFEPRYALKSEDKLVALFELEDCPRLWYYESDSIHRVDIVANSALKEVMNELQKK